MEFDTSIPIYLQVIEQIKKDIVNGTLPIGSKLPSTRELASDKGINTNTVARIYKELEYLDIAYTKRGIGTFITESKDIYISIKNELSKKYVEQFIVNMYELGYSKSEVYALMQEYEDEER